MKDTTAKKKAGKKGGKRSQRLRSRQQESEQRVMRLEQLRVVELVTQGKTFKQIAIETNICEKRVRTLYHDYEAEYMERNDASISQLRTESRTRLTAITRKLFLVGMDSKIEIHDEKTDPNGEVKVMKMEEFEKLRHCAMAMKHMEERLAKLDGLDAPEKVEVGGGLTMQEFLSVASKATKEGNDGGQR